MRVGPLWWDWCPYKKRKRDVSSHCLYHMRTQQEGSHLLARKRALTRNQICQPLNLALSASRNVRNKCLLFQPPGLWYFVTAAWADKDRREEPTLKLQERQRMLKGEWIPALERQWVYQLPGWVMEWGDQSLTALGFEEEDQRKTSQKGQVKVSSRWFMVVLGVLVSEDSRV